MIPWWLKLLAVVALAAGLWAWDAHRISTAEASGYQRARAEDEAAAELRRESNRGRARDAETKHAAAADVRERFIVQTIREVRHEAEPLAACPVPDAVRVRLNAAAECASGDRPAACGADDAVPAAGAAR